MSSTRLFPVNFTATQLSTIKTDEIEFMYDFWECLNNCANQLVNCIHTTGNKTVHIIIDNHRKNVIKAVGIELERRLANECQFTEVSHSVEERFNGHDLVLKFTV